MLLLKHVSVHVQTHLAEKTCPQAEFNYEVSNLSPYSVAHIVVLRFSPHQDLR
jgi:hypothetical protein